MYLSVHSRCVSQVVVATAPAHTLGAVFVHNASTWLGRAVNVLSTTPRTLEYVTSYMDRHRWSSRDNRLSGIFERHWLILNEVNKNFSIWFRIWYIPQYLSVWCSISVPYTILNYNIFRFRFRKYVNSKPLHIWIVFFITRKQDI